MLRKKSIKMVIQKNTARSCMLTNIVFLINESILQKLNFMWVDKLYGSCFIFRQVTHTMIKAANANALDAKNAKTTFVCFYFYSCPSQIHDCVWPTKRTKNKITYKHKKPYINVSILQGVEFLLFSIWICFDII